MGYFAGRAAPLGAVGPEVVTALFYNFAPSRVARALPDAWGFAPPAAALSAPPRGFGRGTAAIARGRRRHRRRLAGAPCRRSGAIRGPGAVRGQQCAAVARRSGGGALARCDVAARAPRRRTRGGADGGRSHRPRGERAHSSSGGAPREFMAVGRDYDEEEWSANVATLSGRGLLEGRRCPLRRRALRSRRSSRNAPTASPSVPTTASTTHEVEEMIAALTPLARSVIDAGDVPPMTPIGPIAAALA